MWPILKKLFGEGKLLQGAKEIFDEVITSKEERALLEIKFRELFNQHEQTIMNAEVEDRSSARKREVELVKSGAKNYTQNILAYLGVGSFFGITAYMISHGLGEMNPEASFIIGNVTGMAAAIAKDVYGYYFGSSKGERDSYKPLMKK